MRLKDRIQAEKDRAKASGKPQQPAPYGAGWVTIAQAEKIVRGVQKRLNERGK